VVKNGGCAALAKPVFATFIRRNANELTALGGADNRTAVGGGFKETDPARPGAHHLAEILPKCLPVKAGGIMVMRG